MGKIGTKKKSTQQKTGEKKSGNWEQKKLQRLMERREKQKETMQPNSWGKRVAKQGKKQTNKKNHSSGWKTSKWLGRKRS